MTANSRIMAMRQRLLTIPEVCVERGIFVTESYKETEGCDPHYRSAKALENVLNKMSIRIEPEETIVGWQTSKTRGCAVLPEVSSQWLLKEMDTVHLRKWDPYKEIPEKDRTILREFLPYWKDRSIDEKWNRQIPADILKFSTRVGAPSGIFHSYGHCAGDYPKLLRIGLSGYRKELEEELANIEPDSIADYNKRLLLNAVLITHDAVIAHANRYAGLAADMAAGETDTARKAELEEISRICRKVPEQPADSFREAIQSCWFVFISILIEGWGAGVNLGRIDQTLEPYYRRDIENGVITKQEAYELLCMLILKMNAAINIHDSVACEHMNGYPIMQGYCIGGIKSDGSDAVNDLSYLILDAMETIALTSDDPVVRINKANPGAFIERAVEVARNVRGKIKFISDDSSIPALQYAGFTLEDARDYISTGCHTPAIPAKSHGTGGGYLSTPLMLELALNDGISRLEGDRIGLKTGDPRNFKSFDELCDALQAQIESHLNIMFIREHAKISLYAEVPNPLLSSFYGDCLEKGIDITRGGSKYRTYTIAVLGIPTVADGLAAVKKTVFDDKTLTMARVLKLLDNDLEGDDEALHLLSKAPKFGNNDPYVDRIARTVSNRIADYIQFKESAFGFKFCMCCVAMTGNIPHGRLIGALPCGRKARQPFSEGGISPHQGRNTAGVTSTLASIAGLDHVRISHGSILNVRINDASVKDKTNLKKCAALLRTFCETGGNLVQFNFVSTETLRAAQEAPDKYRDLLVRVATYSAYFTELSPDLQEDIIKRSELNV